MRLVALPNRRDNFDLSVRRMGTFSLRRVLAAACLAVPAAASIAGVLFFLPEWLAFGSVLAGVVLFQVGTDLEYRWCTVFGGVLAFGALFAWAVRQ